MVSKSEIMAARTERGGWTRAQLAEWGVPWPPPRGWQKSLERGRALSPGISHDAVCPCDACERRFQVRDERTRRDFEDWMRASPLPDDGLPPPWRLTARPGSQSAARPRCT